MAKLKLAMYWAAGCGGCDVAVLDLHHGLLDVAGVADLVFWPIALDFKVEDVEAMADRAIDACLFSGAIRTAENEHMARLLRAKSKLMVAFGSCAHLGGIPGLANFATRRDLFAHVYRESASTVNPDGQVPLESTHTPLGELELPTFQHAVRTLAQVVAVDLVLPGCPPPASRVAELVEALAGGHLPAPGTVVGATSTAVCDECPRTRNDKRITEFRSIAELTPDPETCLLEQGIVCCGPATRGGCEASCVAANMPCRGCFGPLPGVVDQGAKLLSAVASVIDACEPSEIEGIVAQIPDPAGTFYRFSLPGALLPRARPGDVA